jgi:hypothetical protein
MPRDVRDVQPHRSESVAPVWHPQVHVVAGPAERHRLELLLAVTPKNLSPGGGGTRSAASSPSHMAAWCDASSAPVANVGALVVFEHGLDHVSWVLLRA